MKAKALPVSVYRSSSLGDCTNGGVSARYDDLLVLCDDGYITVDLENPPKNLVEVVHRNMWGRDLYHIEPYAAAKGAGWMMGGNYAATSDSRFSKLCGGQYGAVAIHDRDESWELYNSMCD